MNTSRRHAIAVVSTAAVLAGVGGVALGLAIHSAETTSATPVESVTTPTHHATPSITPHTVVVTTPATPVNPPHPVTPVTPVTPVHPDQPIHPVIPQYAGTIQMTITNNTDQSLSLNGSDNPYGDWIVTPQSQLAPGASETVSASTWKPGGFGIDVTYGDSDGSSVVFMANNYGGQTDTSGTRVDGSNPGHWVIQSTVDQGAPNMSASYTLMPGLLNPPVQPDNPVIQPVDPPVQPDNPVIQPVDPPVQPDNPVIQPDNPVVQPDTPVAQPDSSTTPVTNATAMSAE